MGMQQLLTLVLIVVLVGIAIAVGITMFSNSAYQANVQAITAELQTFRARAAEYWRLPVGLGGAGQDLTRINSSDDRLPSYLGFEVAEGKTVQAFVFNSANAEYHYNGCNDAQLSILALGKEAKGKKFPFVSYTYNMLTEETSLEITSAESFATAETDGN